MQRVHCEQRTHQPAVVMALHPQFCNCCRCKRNASLHENWFWQAEIGFSCCIQGIWAHGNLITALPEHIGNLSNLHTISLACNRLEVLHKTISALENLKDFALQGNKLTEAAPELGSLRKCLTEAD